MRMFTKKCTKCLMPESYPDISFNSEGVCSYCLGEKYFGVANDPKIREMMSKKDKLSEDFERTVRECKGRSEYDCLVPISGGKDSSYLAYLLMQHYGLRILTLTVDTGLLNPVAKQNVGRIVKILNVDHIFFTPKVDFFKKLYRHFLTHPRWGHSPTVCQVCTEAVLSIALKEAAKRRIPLVAPGYSPDQIEKYFYEVPQNVIRERSWVPEELNNEPFDEDDRNYFWIPSLHAEGDYFPRVLFPFHVLEYPSTEEVTRRVAELGLVRKGRAHPMATNCLLGWLTAYLDIKKLGYYPFVRFISQRIREEKESRSRRLRAIELLNWSVKSGIFRVIFRRRINHVLKHLDLEMKDLFKITLEPTSS